MTTYAAIAAGELATVSDAVGTITGHRATSFAQFLAGNPETLSHLRRAGPP